MTVIHRPWLYRDDDGFPKFKTSWHDETPARGPRWPGPLREKREFEPHDAETRKLIERYRSLYRLEHGHVVAPMVEEWKWLDSMASPVEKQEFLAPLIERVRRSPERNEGSLIFLLLVCEGIRRGIASELVGARSGLEGVGPVPADHRAGEARWVQQIERERLHDVTRHAVLEAIVRCPTPMPRRFFGWLRQTVAYRTLDFLRDELPEVQTAPRHKAEAEAMQAYMSGIVGETPALADTAGLSHWRLKVRPRALWEAVDEFSQLTAVREVCRTAVDRLPPRQRAVIDAHFYEGIGTAQIASRHGVGRSTIYNQKAQALSSLYEDDCFFVALHGMRLVRDSVRRHELSERYPDGRMPDGRRLVHIDEAA
jgi:RNA polymerase sigma factor (sigma-70 family)